MTFKTHVHKALVQVQLDRPGEEISPVLGWVHKVIDKGRRLIAKRQKLIQITDRLKAGWNVVTYYTVDELAEDSEDEKQLE